MFHTATAFLGATAKGAAAPAPSAPTLRLESAVSTDFKAAAPQNWPFTVVATNLARVKWAVFHVSAAGAYTSDELWKELDTSSGSASATGRLVAVRDRVVVKSLDDAHEAQSAGATFTGATTQPTVGTALQRAKNWMKPLRIGTNVERSDVIWAGWLHDAQLRQYASQGLTHIRIYPPSGGPQGYALMSMNELGNFFDALQRIVNAGLRGVMQFGDIWDPGNVNSQQYKNYIAAASQIAAQRNFDPAMVTFGICNEFGNSGSNVEFQPGREEMLGIMHGALPNHILTTAGAHWNDPGTLIDGTMYVDSSKPRLHEWHKYDNNADDIGSNRYWDQVTTEWAERVGAAVMCGEWGIGPPVDADATAGPGRYWAFPTHIYNMAHGMGRQRPTGWTVTGNSGERRNTWWRYNEWESAALRPEIAAAFREGSDHIAGQQWWIDDNAEPEPGGEPPPPTGSQVSRIQVLHNGQSNAQFAHEDGGPWALQETFQALAGVPVEMISRHSSGDGRNTIHSATFTYWRSPYKDHPRWLNPSNENYGSAPSGWGETDLLGQCKAAIAAFVSGDPEVPLMIDELHWEYDLEMDDAASKAAYRDGHLEKTWRLRGVKPKAAGKAPLMLGYCPYSQNKALFDILAAWKADLADASRDVNLAAGNMSDAFPRTQYDPNGDPSHWGDSAHRIYPRKAFRFARLAWERGWLPSNIDLSDCPALGPRIQSVSRSGNSLAVTVQHDRGSSLLAGQDGIAWAAFTASDGNGENHFDATGGAITGNNTIRVDFPRQPPTGGKLWYCCWPDFRRRQVIRDNWHATKPAKYAGIPNVGVVEFPLQRTLDGVGY